MIGVDEFVDLPEVSVDDLQGFELAPYKFACKCGSSLHGPGWPGDDDYAACLRCGLVYKFYTCDGYDANGEETGITEASGPVGRLPDAGLAEARQIARYVPSSGTCSTSLWHEVHPGDVCGGLLWWLLERGRHVEYPEHDILPDGFRGALRRCYTPSGVECAT